MKLDERTDALCRLMAGIFEHEQAGESVPCVNAARGHWWVSDDPELQQAAVHACSACPALGACRRYTDAHPEPCGVWAGRMTATTRREETDR